MSRRPANRNREQLNRTAHVLSGVAASLWTLPVAPISGVAGSVAWVATTSGYSTAPDLDHRKSALARMWGPVSEVPAWVVRTVFGHRGKTHHPLAVVAAWVIVAAILSGVAVPWLAWALGEWRGPDAARYAATIGNAAWLLTVAWSIGLALAAAKISGWLNLAISLLGAGAVHYLNVPLGWLPWAAALGIAAHLAGDFITKMGLPLAKGKRIRVPLVAITTGKTGERVVKTILAAAIALSPPVLAFYAHLIRVLA